MRWSVNWNEGGRRIAKYFPVKLFGFHLAHELAVKCRIARKVPTESNNIITDRKGTKLSQRNRVMKLDYSDKYKFKSVNKSKTSDTTQNISTLKLLKLAIRTLLLDVRNRCLLNLQYLLDQKEFTRHYLMLQDHIVKTNKAVNIMDLHVYIRVFEFNIEKKMLPSQSQFKKQLLIISMLNDFGVLQQNVDLNGANLALAAQLAGTDTIENKCQEKN